MKKINKIYAMYAFSFWDQRKYLKKSISLLKPPWKLKKAKSYVGFPLNKQSDVTGIFADFLSVSKSLKSKQIWLTKTSEKRKGGKLMLTPLSMINHIWMITSNLDFEPN